MKKALRIFTSFSLIMPTFMVGFLFLAPSIANASPAYNSSYLISDSVFSNSTSMSVSAIQSFLNNENSGLKSYSDVENCNPTTPTLPDPYASSYYQHCGSSQSAAQIIYDAAQSYGINPQVILATLQKEQSLITTPNPTQSQLNCAMGYDSCGNDTGFFNQVDNGAWQFRTDVQLMTGSNWWGYTPSSYACKNASSLYSAGLDPGNTVTFADPGGTAETITLANAPTAALYCYTPYVGPITTTGYSGSYNFVVAFDNWFGSTAVPCYNDNNVSGAKTGANIISYRPNAAAASEYALILPNNTSSSCVETHVLSSPAGQSWVSHIATGMKAFDPTTGQILSYKGPGASGDTLLFAAYNGGGQVTMHEFSPDLTLMPGYYDTNTDLSGVTASTGMFVAGDFLGRGYDQVAFILYNGASGHVEVHLFDPTLQRAIGYYDVPTDLTGINASEGTFVAGDFLGRGYDQLAFILYSNATGHAEVHLFDPTLEKAIGFYDVQTDLTGVTASSGQFVAGDFLGRGYDQLAYILDNGSSGQVEVHMFNRTLQQGIGYLDSVTAATGFDPTQ